MALEGGEVNAGNVVTITGRSLLDKSAPPREYNAIDRAMRSLTAG
jgi:hypothetical protein